MRVMRVMRVMPEMPVRCFVVGSWRVPVVDGACHAALVLSQQPVGTGTFVKRERMRYSGISGSLMAGLTQRTPDMVHTT